MNERELAAWLWPRLKDRLSPPEDWVRKSRWQWRIDGIRVGAWELWGKAVSPILEDDYVDLSFPENYWNITMVVSHLRLQFIQQIGRDKGAADARR